MRSKIKSDRLCKIISIDSEHVGYAWMLVIPGLMIY